MLSSDMSAKPTRPTMIKKPRPAKPVRQVATAKAGPGVVPDGFYKDMVWNLRNGVVAITRDGRVAVMNDIAYRVLGLKPRVRDIGRHFTEVLRDVPDVSRIIAGVFEISHMPNRQSCG
jgi:PAS domain-containing protein